MRPRWSRSSPFPNQSGRQESNLPQTAYQAVASPLSPRPEAAPCTGIEPVFPGRQPGRCTPASSQGVSVSGGSRTRLSDAAGRCLGCSATDTPARTEGVEPSASRLELDCSPGSTPLSISGRDRTRTCKGLRLARLPTGCHRACWLALPYRAVPAGLEPVPVWVTASRTTVVLRDSEYSADRTGIEPERARRTPFPRAYDRCAGSDANPVRQFRRLGSSQRPSPFQGDALTV